MTIRNVPAAQLITKTAEELKKSDEVSPPEWAQFVKTCHARERAPVDPEWWYTRAASVLRRVAMLGPIGTEKLRTHYGGRKNKGHKPEHHYKAGGNILRKVLQQLDKAGLTKTNKNGNRKGRIITPKGQSMLYKLSESISQASKAQAKPAPEPAAKPAPAEGAKKEKVKQEAPKPPAAKQEAKKPEVKEQKAEAPKQEAKSEAPKAKKQPEAKAEKAEEQKSSSK